MSLPKGCLSATLAFCLSFSPVVRADSYALVYNQYLKSYLASAPLAKPDLTLGELIGFFDTVLEPGTSADLRRLFDGQLDKAAPRIEISAQPWVRIRIFSDRKLHTMSFVGDNEVFMTIDGEPLLWEEAKSHEKLSQRIRQILEKDSPTPRRRVWLSLFIPEAHARGGMTKPLIYGGAMVLAAGLLGFFVYKAAKKVSEAKTEHNVNFTGKQEVHGKLDLSGVPDEFKTSHSLNLNAGLSSDLDDFDGKLTLDTSGAEANLREILGQSEPERAANYQQQRAPAAVQ